MTKNVFDVYNLKEKYGDTCFTFSLSLSLSLSLSIYLSLLARAAYEISIFRRSLPGNVLVGGIIDDRLDTQINYHIQIYLYKYVRQKIQSSGSKTIWWLTGAPCVIWVLLALNKVSFWGIHTHIFEYTLT